MPTPYSNREKQLANQGWADMKKRLDQELPVQKRRRFGWLFWMLALLLTGSMAGLAWYVAQPPAQLLGRPSGTEPIASQKAVPSANLPATTISENKPLPLGQSGQTALAATPNTLSHTAPRTSLSEASSVTQTFDILPAEPTPAPSSQIPWIALQPAAPRASSLDQIATLPLNMPVPPVYSTITPNQEHPTTLPIKVKPAFHHLRAGVYAAGAITREQSSVSFSAGGILDWQIRNRFGIRAGLGYQNLQLNGIGRPIIQIADDSYAAITGDTSVLVASSSGFSNNSVLVPITQMHRLEIPVQVWYQIHRNIRAYAGAQVQYTISGSSSGQNLALSNNRLVSSNAQNGKLALDQAASQGLPRWNTQMMLGASYQLGKHLEFGLQYRFSLPELSLQSRDEALYLEPNNSADFTLQTNSQSYHYARGMWQMAAVYRF
ncbi:MAG: outer membrane beta-barrel protein [Lewinellaceae bacterium]|nr:outer membrane beta-barrel protein [Lewinellaceae bacterium]